MIEGARRRRLIGHDSKGGNGFSLLFKRLYYMSQGVSECISVGVLGTRKTPFWARSGRESLSIMCSE